MSAMLNSITICGKQKPGFHGYEQTVSAEFNWYRDPATSFLVSIKS